MPDTVEDDTEQYTSADFWDRNNQSRAALTSAVTSLRLVLSRINQSVDATYAQRSGDERASAAETEETDDLSVPPDSRTTVRPVMKPAERTVLADHRRYLADGISGKVLDRGVGTGAMFPYFREVVTDGASVTLFAVEPDPHMRRQAIERARELGLDIEIESAGAETLPYADDSFDVVIASLVFCTIPDFDAALSEVARVLKPGASSGFSNTSAERAPSLSPTMYSPQRGIPSLVAVT